MVTQTFAKTWKYFSKQATQTQNVFSYIRHQLQRREEYDKIVIP